MIELKVSMVLFAVFFFGFAIGQSIGNRRRKKRERHEADTAWMGQSVELVLPMKDFQRVWNQDYNSSVSIGLNRADHVVVKRANCVHEEVPLSEMFPRNGQATATALRGAPTDQV